MVDLIRGLKRRYWRVRNTLRRRRDRIFDETLGVDTAGHVELSALGTIDAASKPFGTHYLPSPVALVRELLRGLDIRHEDYVFVDLGSGKGRVLLLAAELPFKEIIGVEFSPELHAIALSNIERAADRRDIRAEIGNAALFPIPDANSVIFLANPFSGPVLDAVIGNIAAALRSTPHDILVVYLYPKHRAAFDACRSLAVRDQGENHVIYGRAPAASAQGRGDAGDRPETPRQR